MIFSKSIFVHVYTHTYKYCFLLIGHFYLTIVLLKQFGKILAKFSHKKEKRHDKVNINHSSNPRTLQLLLSTHPFTFLQYLKPHFDKMT